MNKRHFIVLVLISFFVDSFAQIGINTDTPHSSAALDIVSTSKGILIPRMTSAQKLAIVSPNEGLMVYDSDQNCVSVYTFIKSISSMEWTCLTSFSESFFYMPSINIDTSTLGIGRTLDLYTQYKNQFSSVMNQSPSSVPLDVYTPNDLYYYVTYYDATKIKINSISATGVLNYDIIGYANYDTYMNIVFVVK